MGDLPVRVRNESFHLLPEGLLYWPRKKLLAVADFHLGKAETFGQNGLPLPAQAQLDDLNKLSSAITRVEVETLLFLGDLVHTRRGITPDLEHTFSKWLNEQTTEICLIAGNHDRALIQKFPVSWRRMTVWAEREIDGFRFLHDPIADPGNHLFTWAGHIHPCLNLCHGPDRIRLKVFAIGLSLGILPAFSSLAGGFNLDGKVGYELYPFVDNQVLPKYENFSGISDI